MDVSAVSRAQGAVSALGANVPGASTEIPAQNREVVKAVKAVNASEMLGEDELIFQKDQKTQRMLIQVVDRKTREVVSQVPPEYVLQLAEDLKK